LNKETEEYYFPTGHAFAQEIKFNSRFTGELVNWICYAAMRCGVFIGNMDSEEGRLCT